MQKGSTLAEKFSKSRCDTSGGFLLHHFIADSVKSDSDLVVVGLDQTLGHYHGVGLKLGVDLIKRQKLGRLVFVDLLKTVSGAYASPSDTSLTPRSVYESVVQACRRFNQTTVVNI